MKYLLLNRNINYKKIVFGYFFLKSIMSFQPGDAELAAELATELEEAGLHDEAAEARAWYHTITKESAESKPKQLERDMPKSVASPIPVSSSAWILDNPNGKYNEQGHGAASVNAILIEPKGYIEGWIKIWKVLNGYKCDFILSEDKVIEITRDIREIPVEERQIAKHIFQSEEISVIAKNLNEIRKLKNRGELTIKEIIGTLYAIFRINI